MHRTKTTRRTIDDAREATSPLARRNLLRAAARRRRGVGGRYRGTDPAEPRAQAAVADAGPARLSRRAGPAASRSDAREAFRGARATHAGRRETVRRRYDGDGRVVRLSARRRYGRDTAESGSSAVQLVHGVEAGG